MASIRKRGTKFHVQVRRSGFPTQTRSFTKLSDAKEWARVIETKADRAELAPNRSLLKSLTLAELIIRYRDEVLPNKRGGDFETTMLNAFLRHPICKKPLSDLSQADFAAWREERTSRARTNQPITLKSAKRILSPVQRLLQVAMDEWEIPLRENPLARLNLRVADNRRERRLREGELDGLIQAASKCRNPFLVPIIRFALETAMRRGEILALKWADIDLFRGTATIRKSKNGFSRIIPLTSHALDILGELDERQNGEPVFPTTAMAVRMSWDRLCKRAGIDDLNFHDLRHEAVSRLFEKGLTVPEVASISGHRDMRMLFRYAHANHQSIRIKLESADV